MVRIVGVKGVERRGIAIARQVAKPERRSPSVIARESKRTVQYQRNRRPVWIDPDAEAVVVLLTNRVHHTRDNAAIRAAPQPAASGWNGA